MSTLDSDYRQGLLVNCAPLVYRFTSLRIVTIQTISKIQFGSKIL